MDSHSLESYCTAKPLKTADQTPSYSDPYDSSNKNSYKYQGQSPQCSNGVINEVNTWAVASNKYWNASSQENLIAMVESCHRLKTLTGGNTCYIGQTELNYQQLFGKVCDKAENTTPRENDLSAPAPMTQNPAAGQNQPADTITVKSKIVIVGLQPINLSKRLNAGQVLLFQNGSLVNGAELLEDGPACKIEALVDFKGIVAKKEIVFNRVVRDPISGETNMISDDSKISISCGLNRKGNNSQYSAQNEVDFNLTLKGLNATLEKWFKVVKADL